jgi:uncharacterized protein with NAD-binding domain and iron-sulfur cluster
MRKPTVAICGAGIAGLACAHELIKRGYEVHIYEYADTCGGQARSARKPDGFPTEYSWRGYGQFYKNVYEVMQDIPSPQNLLCEKSNDTALSVYDTELSKPVQFILTRDKEDDTSSFDVFYQAENWSNQISISEWAALEAQFFREIIADKRINEYAKINAKEWLYDKLYKNNLVNVVSVFGPWVGITSDRLSLHHMMNFFRMIKYPDLNKPYSHMEYTNCNVKSTLHSPSSLSWMQKSGSQWSVLKRPSNESWFDPWEKYLREKGVQFHFGSKIVKILNEGNTITGIDVVCNKKIINVICDYYVLAVTPFAVYDIISNSSERIQHDKCLSLFKGLTRDGPHIQVSFFIGFEEKVNVPHKGKQEGYIAYILPDSEYNLTLYFQDDVWYNDVYLGPNIKSIISGTACVSYVPGKLFGKTLKEVTEEEFKEEVLHQLYKCNNFCSIMGSYNNKSHKSFKDFKVSRFEVWDGWKFPDAGLGNMLSQNNDGFRKTETILAHDAFCAAESILSQLPNERKWVNSTDTNPFMPSIQTSFNNLFIAGAHVKSSVDLYSMETACATGRDAAFNIMHKYGVSLRALTIEKPIWAKILSVIDNLLYMLCLPSTIDTLSIIIVLSVILCVMRNK